MNFITSNPRLLVDILPYEIRRKQDTYDSLDAIFIPYTARYNNVIALLEELKWYKGPIYLFPSTVDDILYLKNKIDSYTHYFLKPPEYFNTFFNRLLTSQKEYSFRITNWDLPLKRNYILFFSRQNGFRKVLLVDDDIRGLIPDKLTFGISLLNKYSIAGCFIENFPDTSILGHLHLEKGEKVFTFLSGSMLILKPFDTLGFFPKIYNEDWLFMIPHVMNRSICAFGSCNQVFKNPFDEPKLAYFQEFGDIIAEVLYSLIEKNRYNDRSNFEIWEKAIYERLFLLKDLKKHPIYLEQKPVIEFAIQAHLKINPKICMSFISDWESDTKDWQNYLKEFS